MAEKDITPKSTNFSTDLTKDGKVNESSKPRSKFGMILALIFMGIALVYDISPVDVIPDVIPVVGWGDDLFITGLAFWNLIRQIRARKKE